MLLVFSNYLPDFQHYLRFEKRYSRHTLTAYSTDLLQLACYLEENYPTIPVDKITHSQLRGWLALLKENKLSGTSINRKISSASNYFSFLIRKGICTQNPTKLLHAVRTSKNLPYFLKESETEELLNKVEFGEDFEGNTKHLILELLYTCGLRRAELLALKESDIEWNQKQLLVLGKGNKERLIPISESLLDKLRHYISLKRKEHGPKPQLFVRANGEPLYEKYIYHTVKEYLSKVCSLQKRSPHVLRHTFATHLLNQGASIQAIKELLGHSSIAATQIYTHINIDKLKKVHKLNHPKG